MRKIPFGKTSSYTKVAEAIGAPKAVRAVGSTCTRCWFAFATYSSNCARNCGYLISTVLSAKPPRKTHFSQGCQATPTRGWKFLL